MPERHAHHHRMRWCLSAGAPVQRVRVLHEFAVEPHWFVYFHDHPSKNSFTNVAVASGFSAWGARHSLE